MSTPPQLTYRADVDGLRAVAILAVIGFHAAPALVPGGFIGVDVFFVISGYLISSIILKGLACGSFRYADFYARRIKRIFPALIVVLLTVWVLGWFVLLPDEYRGLGKHIAAGAGFISNIALWKEAGYFDTAAELKPLLHLWSLGVEEQFYLVWPLFLVLTWRRGVSQFGLIVLITLVSFSLNMALAASHPVPTFFLPSTRFWELSVGAALSYAQLFKGEQFESLLARLAPGLSTALRRDLQAVAGVVLLAVAMVVLNRYRIFPGGWALLPVTGAFLLISAGSQAWFNRRVLGSRLMVFVGLISYPLYLWHWPLLSLARIVDSKSMSPAVTLACVALAFSLAVLTYRYIELPVRSFRRKQVAIPLFLAASAAGICGFLVFRQAFMPRSVAYGVDRILQATAERSFLGSPRRSVLIQGSAPNQVLFIGDSNVAQYYPRMVAIFSRYPPPMRSVVFVTGGGCPPIFHVKETHHPHCAGFLEQAMEYARRASVEAIVIGASWHSYFVDPDPRYAYYFQEGEFTGELRLGTEAAQRAFDALESMLSAFAKQGKRVYLVLQIPVDHAFNPRTMIKRGFHELNFTLDTRPLLRVEVERGIQPVVAKLQDIARRTGAIAIDPLQSLCGPVLCPIVTPDGDPVYMDGIHLRPSYVRDHVDLLDAVLLPEQHSKTGPAR